MSLNESVIHKEGRTAAEPVDAEKVTNLNLHAHKSRHLKAQTLTNKGRNWQLLWLATDFKLGTLPQAAFNTKY